MVAFFFILFVFEAKLHCGRIIRSPNSLVEISMFCSAVLVYVRLISSGGNILTVPSSVKFQHPSCYGLRFVENMKNLRTSFIFAGKSPDF